MATKKFAISKIKTGILTGALALCLHAYADTEATEPGSDNPDANDSSNKMMVVGAVGGIAALGVGLAVINNDNGNDGTHTTDPTTPGTPYPVSIRGIKIVSNPYNKEQLVVFSGQSAKILDLNNPKPSKRLAAQDLLPGIQSNSPSLYKDEHGKPTIIANIVNYGNNLIVITDQGTGYVYSWTPDGIKQTAPALLNDQYFGKDTPYLKNYYLGASQAVSFDSPQGLVLIHRDQGIRYQNSTVYKDYNGESISSYFNKALGDDACDFNSKGTSKNPCGITTAFSYNNEVYLFQKNKYVIDGLIEGGRARIGSVADFLKPYVNDPSRLNDESELDALFVDTYLDPTSTKDNTKMIDGSQNWNKPKQDSEDEIFSLGDSSISVKATDGSCLELSNKTSRNFTKIRIELNPNPAFNNLLSTEIAVNKIHSFTTSTYCINDKSISLKNYSLSLAPLSTGSDFNLSLDGFWSFRGDNPGDGKHTYTYFYRTEKIQFTQALNEFKFLLNNQKEALRDRVKEKIGSDKLPQIDEILNKFAKLITLKTKIAPIMLKKEGEGKVGDVLYRADFPDVQWFGTLAVDYTASSDPDKDALLQKDLVLGIFNVVYGKPDSEEKQAILSAIADAVQEEMKDDYNKGILDPTAHLKDEILE